MLCVPPQNFAGERTARKRVSAARRLRCFRDFRCRDIAGGPPKELSAARSLVALRNTPSSLCALPHSVAGEGSVGEPTAPGKNTECSYKALSPALGSDISRGKSMDLPNKVLRIRPAVRFVMLVCLVLVIILGSIVHDKLRCQAEDYVAHLGMFSDTGALDWDVLRRSGLAGRLSANFTAAAGPGKASSLFLRIGSDYSEKWTALVVALGKDTWRSSVAARLRALPLLPRAREVLATAEWSLDGKRLPDDYPTSALKGATLRLCVSGLVGGMPQGDDTDKPGYDKMSLADLRILAMRTPGMSRTAKDATGKHKDKGKAQLLSEFQALDKEDGRAPREDAQMETRGRVDQLQPLAEQTFDSGVIEMDSERKLDREEAQAEGSSSASTSVQDVGTQSGQPVVTPYATYQTMPEQDAQMEMRGGADQLPPLAEQTSHSGALPVDRKRKRDSEETQAEGCSSASMSVRYETMSE